MDDRTQRIAAALADVPPTLLQTLVETAHEVSDQAPGLLAWLDHAATWELDRGEGRTYLLQEPLAAIDDSEVPLGLDALAALSDQLGNESTLTEGDRDCLLTFIQTVSASISQARRHRH